MDVPIRCICPIEERHDSDTVTLRDRLDFRTVVTIRKSMETIDDADQTVKLARRLAICTEFYLLMGIESWTLRDAKGKPIEVSHHAIRTHLLESPEALPVYDKAEDLYNPVVLLPLMVGASKSSPPTPTDESTSQKKDSPLTPPRPLKRSSTSTTQTVGIETTSSSLGGVSNSSQSSQSAA